MPVSDKQVLEALSELVDPVTGRNYVESKNVKNVKSVKSAKKTAR